MTVAQHFFRFSFRASEGRGGGQEGGGDGRRRSEDEELLFGIVDYQF